MIFLASASDVANHLNVDLSAEMQMLSLEAKTHARRAVNVMRNKALDVLGHDGHGRKYGRHTASAPGEPPAPDMGNLRRKWRQYVLAQTNSKGAEITCRLKSEVAYATRLEKGSTRVKPRPFTDRIIEESLPEINALYDNLR